MLTLKCSLLVFRSIFSPRAAVLPGPPFPHLSTPDMYLIIRENREAASAYVANLIVERIKQFAPTRARPFVLGLPTGSTPLGVYRILVEKYKAGEV